MAYAPTGYAVARTEYGGFWVRVVAAVIDGVLLAVVGFVLGLVIVDRSTESLVSTVSVRRPPHSRVVARS